MEQLDPRIVAVVGGLILLLILGAVMMSRRKNEGALRDRYGSDYDRQVKEHGSTKAAAEIAGREKRFQKAQIRDLTPADRERFTSLWQTTQSRFVDSPVLAVSEADRLIAEVMGLRGYPSGDHEQRLSDVAIGHPALLEHYRDACGTARRVESGQRDTEDMRKAFVHYRALFEELVGHSTAAPVAVNPPPPVVQG